MGDLKTVLRFGLHYMRPYWSRLLAGILLGCFCGLTAGSFIWATRTLAQRLAPAEQREAQRVERKPKKQLIALPDSWQGYAKKAQAHFNEYEEEWLPRIGAEFTAKRIFGALMLLPLLALLRGASDYLSGYCMGWVSERVIADLRYDVLDKLTSLSLDYFNTSTTGDMLTRINQDTLNLQRALRQGCADLVKESVTIVSVLGALLLVDWKLTLITLVFVPVVILPLMVLGKKARRASRQQRKANVNQTSMLVEALSGIRVVKAFNLERTQLDRFREFARRMVHHGMKGVQAKELVNPIIEVIAALGLGALVLYLFWSNETLGDLVTFVTGLAFFFTPVKKIAGVHILFEQAGAGVERIVELLNEKPTVTDPAQPRPLKSFEKEIRFEQAEFRYSTELDLVVRDLNLRVPRGFKLGIAGESGSGKSTIVNLLFRFYDVTGGRITIDGIDVREISFADLRAQMALVSQDVFVFRMTVAENIAAGRPNATREEIIGAARAANAHDFISALPEGYDTLIGERGMTLSGGQRQRLAIARAFIRNAPILVLDEATASLDSQSEAEVQAAIDRLEENRTVVCVAHRLSTLQAMDNIIVLSKGRVVEQGTFDELLSNRGTFATMAARQGIFAGAAK
jgi:ATP-binding cassette, subfamily B, bacterial MsbA